MEAGWLETGDPRNSWWVFLLPPASQIWRQRARYGTHQWVQTNPTNRQKLLSRAKDQEGAAWGTERVDCSCSAPAKPQTHVSCSPLASCREGPSVPPQRLSRAAQPHACSLRDSPSASQGSGGHAGSSEEPPPWSLVA